jgi:hypothetical protein
MTRNFDLVGSMPFPADESPADKVTAALASVDDAVSLLRAASGEPPLPPARLTLADRLFGASTTD